LEINILVGGAAGQGMETVMNLLGKALVREGFGLISSKDYMSRVRGGHNYSRLRIVDTTPLSPVENADIIVALNEETYILHRENLHPQGRIIYDPSSFNLPDDEERGVPVKLQELAREAGSRVMANTVAVGATWYCLDSRLGSQRRSYRKTLLVKREKKKLWNKILLL